MTGLIRWLNDNGYKIPDGADRVIGSYLKQDMRFFVAKVNLEEQKKSGTPTCARCRSPMRATSSCCRSASAR